MDDLQQERFFQEEEAAGGCGGEEGEERDPLDEYMDHLEENVQKAMGGRGERLP